MVGSPVAESQRSPNTSYEHSHERYFYQATDAFGRFGMRLFEPQCMDNAHWHGHIELNFLVGGTMEYLIDGERIIIPEKRLALFWAGIPHQLTYLQANKGVKSTLCNIYLPVDAFLLLPHITQLQVSALGGGLILLPDDICDLTMIERWYTDYRSGDFERIEVVKMELNALMRRAQFSELDYLREPFSELGEPRSLSSVHMRHVVGMVRFILDNLTKPIGNADVAQYAGLHKNYALALFSQIMRMPVKRFIIRMRLMRSRAYLLESSLAINAVAEKAGFSSLSQFYFHFKQMYGLSPNVLRMRYVKAQLR